MLNFKRGIRLRRLRLCDLPITDTCGPAENQLAGAYLFGVPALPPLAVREPGGYRVLLGAGRIAAARSAGLRRIPVLLVPSRWCSLFMWLWIGSTDSDPIKRARFLADTLALVEKKRLAEILGTSANAITQRVRLLQLPPEQQLKAASLAEGQLLEIIKLPASLRAEALAEVIAADLSPTATKHLVEEKLSADTIKARGRRRMVVKDGRIFQNTIRRSVELMQEAGLEAEYDRLQDGEYVEYRIRVPETQLVAGSKKVQHQ